jgi:hypothetical protein
VQKRLFFTLASLLAVASLIFAAIASGDHGRAVRGGFFGVAFQSSLAPSVPTDPAFHNVGPGGAPWRLDRGFVLITNNGRFILVVRGLVLTSTGTAGPVTTISASLFCGADTVTTPAATTSSVPLTSSGNAIINQHVTLPATCLAPIVLVHPNGGTARYIAVSGWRP